MTPEQANGASRRKISTPATVVAAVTCALAIGGWLRWERPPMLPSVMPRPAYSVVESMEITDRGGCTFDLRVEGPERDTRDEFQRLAEGVGWTLVSEAGARMTFERERRTLRITVRPPLVQDPRWSRVRVVATRCGGAH